MGSVLRAAPNNLDEFGEKWIPGSQPKQLNENYVEILQEKEKIIEGLENELSLTERVIDRQRKTIQDLMREQNFKKDIVADWIDPQPVINSEFPGPEQVDGYITINV